jgi:hypothetical protein
MTMRAEPTEALGDEPVARLEADLSAALKRKPAHEDRLAGAIRALVPFSPRLRAAVMGTLDTLVRRRTHQRPLYAGCVRALAESGERRASGLLGRALADEDAGGLPALSAACLSDDPVLGDPLARIATSRHPHLAFAAEVARVARRESNGEHVHSLAPKIKESHRIALCMEVFVPLQWFGALPVDIAPALAVLRDAERHLGRWLVLGEIAVRAGDVRPLEEARQRAVEGPASARAAWEMVAWALGGSGAPAPSVRPTVELVARLSDRPSADRDTTFLYRLAAAGISSARPMLENLVKGTALGNPAALRAALYLARDHGRDDVRNALADAAKNPRREALRGLAAAALFDAGDRTMAMTIADELVASRQLTTLAWAGLIRAFSREHGNGTTVVSEPAYRRVQLGWVE